MKKAEWEDDRPGYPVEQYEVEAWEETDPPTFGFPEEMHTILFWFFVAVIFIAIFLFALFWPLGGPAKAQETDRSAWFESLRPPAGSPGDRKGWKSCCGAGDVVKARFRVERGGDGWSERWFAQREGSEAWIEIPPDIVLDTPSIDGQGYLFETYLLNGENGNLVCFVKPSGRF